MVSYLRRNPWNGSREVLILVVVDNGLVQQQCASLPVVRCLNPCCSGQWSRTDYEFMVIEVEAPES